ncbi:zinc finger, C2H2 type [Cooperia oncophora]
MFLTIEERIEVILLSGNGRTHREIADEFSRLHPDRKPISHTTVGNLLAKFRETGAVYDRGRPVLMPNKNFNGCGSPIIDRALDPSGDKAEASTSSAYGSTQGRKRYRYAVVAIKDQSSDDLYDLLIDNGFSDFLLLDNLSDHPDFEEAPGKKEPKPVISLECDSDISRAPSSSEATPDIPYFAELSAADLLGGGSGDVGGDDGKHVDRKPSPLFENHPSSFMNAGQLNNRSENHESSGEGTDSETADGDAARGRNDYQTPYVVCQLCKKVIMASRFSNLTNHARRHSVIKKFKCVYCDLQHNEHAKIRTHMLNIHADGLSEAIDNSWRMKKVWEFLVQKCFPHYTPNSGESQPVVAESDLVLPPTTGSVAFVCGICGFHGVDQWRVRLHITTNHVGVEAGSNVRTIRSELNSQANLDQIEASEGSSKVAVIPSKEERPTEAPTGSKEDTSFEVYVSKNEDVEDGLRSLICRIFCK